MKQRHKPLLAHTGIEEDAGNTWLKTSSTDHRAARVLSMANPLDGLHDADHAKAEKTEGRMPSVSDPRALARLLELILSTAQAGLAFSKDRFDIGRFRALQHAVAEFIASDQGVAYERVENWIALDSHYPTPKLDVRALILDSQQRVLLVREASDSRWTLPGGWCDVNESPADAVVRETQEESGLEVRAIRLLALLDKHKHPHPPPTAACVESLLLLPRHRRQSSTTNGRNVGGRVLPGGRLAAAFRAPGTGLADPDVMAANPRGNARGAFRLAPPTSWSHRAADGLTLTTSSRRTRQIDRPVDERLPPSPSPAA